mmetsp:Transcript_94060/g.249745  ORF Transcript_94060/g.249745 Transcript_94060/m.249745 type:complete len:389 (+) Transcript_94060:268-1434(+)
MENEAWHVPHPHRGEGAADRRRAGSRVEERGRTSQSAKLTLPGLRALAQVPEYSSSSSERLAADHEPRRREAALDATACEADTTSLQHHLSLHRAIRHNPQPLEQVKEEGHNPEHDGVELEPWPLQGVPGRRQRHIPRLSTSQSTVDGDIARLQHLEARVAERLGADRGVNDVRQAVTNLNIALDLLVLGRGGVEVVRQAPLVASEDSPRFEYAQDLAVDFCPVGCVACGLNGVDAIEGCLREGQLHEVSLDQLHLSAQPLAGGELVATVHLELVDSDSLDLSAREAGDVPGGSTNAATAVEDFGTMMDAQASSQVVLMAQDGLAESLSCASVREVKARAPSPLIELCRQIVVGVHEGGIVGVAVVRRLLCTIEIVVAVDLAMLLRVR